MPCHIIAASWVLCAWTTKLQAVIVLLPITQHACVLFLYHLSRSCSAKWKALNLVVASGLLASCVEAVLKYWLLYKYDQWFSNFLLLWLPSHIGLSANKPLMTAAESLYFLKRSASLGNLLKYMNPYIVPTVMCFLDYPKFFDSSHFDGHILLLTPEEDIIVKNPFCIYIHIIFFPIQH